MPTFVSELRRGVNAYNLGVGAATAAVAGAAVYGLTAAGFLPDVMERGAAAQALVSTAAVFTLVTGIHAGMHAYFGWRFGRGLAANATEQHERAARLLAPVARRGMDHYDLEGEARRALDASRKALIGKRGSPGTAP